MLLPWQEQNNLVRDDLVKLDPERKFLTNLIKIVAYQAESDLLRLVAPHYKRTEQEGRTLIQSALAAPADLEVTAEKLRVRISPLSSPRRSRAIAALCDELNRRSTRFPGSRLRLNYAVREASWRKADNFGGVYVRRSGIGLAVRTGIKPVPPLQVSEF